MASSPYINHFIQPDSIIPKPSDPQSWNRYSYVQNNPIRYNDPTGHYVANGDNTSCSDDYSDLWCEWHGGEDDDQEKKNNESGPRKAIKFELSGPGKEIDYISASAGLSVPSWIILSGGLMCITAALCVVGGPLAEAGLILYSTPVNLLSLGPVYTQDSYGNVYLGIQAALGKNVPGTPLGFEITGHKIDSSPDYVSESENRSFIPGVNIAVNSIGFPGLSAARIPPTGKSVNPMSGETTTSGTWAGSVLYEIGISYSWELPFNIGSPSAPWGNPANANK